MSSQNPQTVKPPQGQISYNSYRVVNNKTGRKIRLYKQNSRAINPLVKKLLKEDINNIKDIPKDYVIDRNSKKIIRRTDARGKTTKQFTRLIKEMPKQIKYSKNNDLIYDTVSKKYYRKSDVLKKGKLSKFFKNKGYTVFNNVLVKKFVNPFKQFGATIVRNNGLVKKRIFQSNTPINTLDNFLKFIRETRNKVSGANTPADSQKVLLKIGSLFRWIPMSDILGMTGEQLSDMLSNWSNQSWGSDTTTSQGADLISPEYLDKTYFMLQTTGANFGHSRTKVNSKYWKCDQPPTKNNTCLEGAINRFLQLNRSAKTLRKEIIGFTNNYIKDGQLIDIKDLEIYENYFKINIKVYEDMPHFSKELDVEEPNLIRDTETNYEKTLKLLLKDTHVNLIIGKKLQLNEISIAEQKYLGIYKKPKEISKKEKLKKKEILVIFDIETVFNKNNEQFLEPYSVSWFVWEKDKPFDYNNGKLADGNNEYDYEPYCFYKRGKGCLDELLKFLLVPPEGSVYRPIGYNNSRFDNFALCEVASNKGVLTNVFYADGSILYNIINGCLPSWDACRFLTGKSLDSACKDYNTNPKKRPDLISHYTIQVYWEKYGWDGLNQLLDNNEDLVVYNKLDVLCLLDLTLKMRKSYEELFSVDVLDFLTLSSMGYKIFENRLKEANLDIVRPLNYADDRFFRDSLTAGRTQSFYGKYDYKMPLAMGDIKSLYPTVMGNYSNNCPYPYGKYFYTETEKEGKLGIYRVNIRHQRAVWKNKDTVYKQFEYVKKKYGYDLFREYAPNVIAKREKDKPLDWFWKDEINDVKLTSVDIEVLRWATEDRDCVEVLDGYYWDDSRTDIFNLYLDPPRLEKGKQDRLKEKKKDLKRIYPDKDEKFLFDKMNELYGEDYNEAKREGCKGISNSLSGKLLEAIHTDVNCLFTSQNFIKLEKDKAVNEVEILDFGNGFSLINGKKDEKNVFEDTKYDKRKPSYLGMFVYSYARRLMYQKILSRYITLYMDTDSACMPLCEWDRLCNEYKGLDFVNTGEYGCIEEEVCDFKKCDKCKSLTEKEYENLRPQMNGKRCPECEFIPADRIISIAPKNYLVENTNAQYNSKRKFKGVRKNDFWLPLSYFGNYYKKENGKLGGTAVEIINNMSQDEIRRIRETKCCVDCIPCVLSNEDVRCAKCKEIENLTKKTYTTEMFEYLERGEKIAIFCSIINRIKYKVSNIVEWEYVEKIKTPTLTDLEFIISNFKKDGTKQPIQMKFNVSEEDAKSYLESIEKIKEKAKKIDEKKQSAYIKKCLSTMRKFKNEDDTNCLKDLFKLKQQFLIKII